MKRKRVERFLREHDKVKVTMRFRGREVTHPEIGHEILERLQESVSEVGEIETPPKLEGRQMTMVLAPVRGAGRSGTTEDFEDEPDAATDDAAASEDAVAEE